MFGNAIQDFPRFLKTLSLLEFGIPRCLTTLEEGLGVQTFFKLGLILNIENVLKNIISSRITLQEINILNKHYGHLNG
jgi:hypothetical protein